MIFNKNIFKVMGKMLLGIVSTIVIEVIFIIGLYRLVPGPGYVDPLPFLFKYPPKLLIISSIFIRFPFFGLQIHYY